MIKTKVIKSFPQVNYCESLNLNNYLFYVTINIKINDHVLSNSAAEVQSIHSIVIKAVGYGKAIVLMLQPVYEYSTQYTKISTAHNGKKQKHEIFL